jgi:Putative prokaryotic signal transducing protein
MHDHEIVEIYTAADEREAHFLSNLLADAGIEARVVGDTISSLQFPPGEKTAPSIWVKHADEVESRRLITEWETIRARPHSDDEPRPAWKCSACGELVDEDFELCWNCQNPRTPYMPA